jgi:hypothetical protein
MWIIWLLREAGHEEKTQMLKYLKYQMFQSTQDANISKKKNYWHMDNGLGYGVMGSHWVAMIPSYE